RPLGPAHGLCRPVVDGRHVSLCPRCRHPRPRQCLQRRERLGAAAGRIAYREPARAPHTMTNPLPNLVWRIGAAHTASPDLADNFRRPDVFGAAEWVVGRAGQHWPLFHASEADPEGGYQHYAHTVVFTLS